MWIVFVAGLALLVLVFFVLLWWLDARRAKQVERDPERTDPQPDAYQHKER